jgi:hypothetical protein
MTCWEGLPVIVCSHPETDYLGLVPQYARIGDLIAVLPSCDMPIVFRPNGKHYEVIGCCFVERLMNGEAAKGVEEQKYQMEQISLC